MKLARLSTSVLAGALFGVGLTLSGMTRPEKVIGFLDLGGDWDPSLALVMAGAIAVHVVAYRMRRGRSRPFFATSFALPTRKDIDLRLVVGAAVFGVGWGLAGYCPGPGLASLAAGGRMALLFVAGLAAGMLLVSRLEARAQARARVPPPEPRPELPAA